MRGENWERMTNYKILTEEMQPSVHLNTSTYTVRYAHCTIMWTGDDQLFYFHKIDAHLHRSSNALFSQKFCNQLCMLTYTQHCMLIGIEVCLSIAQQFQNPHRLIVEDLHCDYSGIDKQHNCKLIVSVC
jgi:hypothetical protein